MLENIRFSKMKKEHLESPDKNRSIKKACIFTVLIILCLIIAAADLLRSYNTHRKVRFAIKPQFDFAFDFSGNGLAVVAVNGKYGYIEIKC